jgi:hypothetical protein
MSKSVNAITLECMINPKIYSVATKHQNESNDASDCKFYKKRAIALTKSMFDNKICNNNMKKAFDVYLKDCIEHFKFQDTFDILQDEFSGIPNTPPAEKSGPQIELDLAMANKTVDITTRKIFNNPHDLKPLDKFVKISKAHISEPDPPVQKNIDLSDPKLKRKGLKKKKGKE